MRRLLLTLCLLLLGVTAGAQDFTRWFPPGGGGAGGGAFTAPLLAPAANNCAAVPYSFTGDENTGLCTSAADTANLYTAGSSRLAISSTAVTSTVPLNFPVSAVNGYQTALGITNAFDAAHEGFYLLGDWSPYFNATRDPVMFLGYNVSTQGTRRTAGEPVLANAFEADYEVTPGVHWMEWYVLYTNPGGTLNRRPFFFRVNRADDTVTASINSDITNFSTPDGVTPKVMIGGDNHLYIYAGSIRKGNNHQLFLEQKDSGGTYRSVLFMNNANNLMLGDTNIVGLLPNITDTMALGGTSNLWTNAYVGRSVQGSKSKALTDNVATAFARISIPQTIATNYKGGQVIYEIYCDDDTNQASQAGTVKFTCHNIAGTEACGFGTPDGVTLGDGTASLAAPTFDANSGAADTIDLRVNSDCTGVVPNTHTIQWRVDMPTTATVAAQ